MDLLKRELAPILPEAWKAIDDEARRVLELHLGGRKVVDFSGPHGFRFAAVSTGRMELLREQPRPGISVGVRTVQPIVELRTPIVLDLMELDAIARGADTLRLDAVVRAAEAMALTEDGAVFQGYAAGQIAGIVPSSPHAPIAVEATGGWLKTIVHAEELLRAAGVGGPYALVLGSRAFDALSAASEDGYPLRKRIERTLVDGPFVWAPALDGAVLLSTRGGDFELTVGQDLSIGYAYHEKHAVELYLTESFTFRVLEPAAAVWLKDA